MEDLHINGNESVGDAEAFSATSAYAIGDVCTYNGKIYVFTAAHAAGAWTGTDVKAIGDAGDIDFLKINTGWIKQIETGGHVYTPVYTNIYTWGRDLRPQLNFKQVELLQKTPVSEEIEMCYAH